MSKIKNRKKQSVKNLTEKEIKPVTQLFRQISEYKHLGAIISLLYFFIVGIVSFIFHTVGDYGIETDFFWGYVPGAKGFLKGIIPMDAFRGPLYPMVLGVVGFLFGDFFKAGIFIGVLSASAVIYVTHGLLKKIANPALAFFVTLIVAVNPVFIQYSYSAGTDMFFNALAAVTIFFFLKEKEFNSRNLILSGFFGGLSYLTRYNGIFLLSFIVVILLVNFWKLPWLKRFKASAIFLIVFLITFSPWGFYTLSEKGSFFYNENFKNIAYEMHGKGKIGWDDFWFKESSKITSLSDVVFQDPSVFISTTISNVEDHFINDMEKLMGWHTGVFVILGLVVLIISNPFKNWKSRENSYYVINLFFFVLLLLVFYSERFSLFLIPFYAMLAFYPFLGDKTKTGKLIPKNFSYVLLTGLIIFTFVKSYSFNSMNIDSGPKELLTLRDWYFQNVPEPERGKRIAARKAHVAYYLDMEFKLLPMTDNYEELINKLKEQQADYLYFSTIEAAMRRQFQFLLDPSQNHPGLETVVYFENPPAVLYKVLYN